MLFPHFAQCPESPAFLLATAERVEADLLELLAAVEINDSQASEIIDKFFNSFSKVSAELNSDATFIYSGDPASTSVDEIILAYPGFFAIAAYRVAHELERQGVPIIPRLVSEYAHQRTGIDIHPGCEIKAPFFIDHGTGIVIGATTVIGHRVKVYQGVTLGALSVRKEDAHSKRHPTIEDDVILYASAVILGGDTVIGERSIVGGNVWLTESIPKGSVVYRSAEVRVRGTADILKHPPIVQTH